MSRIAVACLAEAKAFGVKSAELSQSRYRGRIRMTVAEHYAELAERYVAKAGNEENLRLKAEWEHLADCYAQLAESPDRLTARSRGSSVFRN